MKLKGFFLIGGILLGLVFVVWLIRAVNVREVDDVNPLMGCTDELLQSNDILWVVPLYKNVSIADNSSWCSRIKSLNKTLGMHGVYHSYDEFGVFRDEEYIDRGVAEFEKCFGFRPKSFKAPQLVLSSSDIVPLKNEGLKVYYPYVQLFRKGFHCGDTGAQPNWLIKLF